MRDMARDEELGQMVLARLHSRLGDRVRDFQLSDHEDGLILRGQVGTYYCKQLAQEIVMELSKLPILANEIEVLRGRSEPEDCA